MASRPSEAGRAGRAVDLDALHLARLLPTEERSAPIVACTTPPATLAWLGSVFGTRGRPVGVDGFGQSGSVEELYGVFDLLPEQLVNAALVAVA